MAKVWEVHFVVNGVTVLGRERNDNKERWGILYHLFSSEADAKAFADSVPGRGEAVIQHREWHHTFIDSPFVTDYRKKDEGADWGNDDPYYYNRSYYYGEEF